jgi:hypothetical protein
MLKKLNITIMFKSYIQFINEDFIGFMQDRSNKTVEIYKNPKSIKKFEANTRALINKDGDLYIADNSYDLMHVDIKDYLAEKHPNEGVVKRDFINQIHLQRFGNTNDFFFSEMYDEEDLLENEKTFIKILEKAKKKNPKYTFNTEIKYSYHI